MPDQWQPPTVAATDRLELDWPAASFAQSGIDTLGNVLIAFVPRSIAAGWWDWRASLSMNPIQFRDLQPDLSAVNTGVPNMASNPYVLLIATAVNGQWLALDAQTGGAISGYNSIQFARSDLCSSNVDSARIVGAGIKVWSDEAPINTGGTCYGGWTTVQALQATLGQQFGTGRTGTAPELFQDELLFRKIHQGVEGITVRYSPLQSAEQEHFVSFQMPDNLVQYDTGVQDPSVTFGENFQPFVYDQVTPGTYVPCVVWNFGSGDSANAYSLRVQAVAHLQCRPKPLSPFMQITPTPDPLYMHLASLLENKDAFPVAVTGHSFKKFMSKALKHAQTLFKHADDVSKFLGLASSFASRFA